MKPALILAHTYRPGRDHIDGWLASEKLDGIRAYWDGRGALWSRAGNRFAKAPDRYLDLLPRGCPLDGELYLGRGRFNDTVRAVKGSDGWGSLRYVVFDAPAARAGFEDRLRVARLRWNNVLPQVPVANAGQLAEMMRIILAQGGEGVMLRRPGSPYVAGRSRDLLKVKATHDREAEVVGYEHGKGRHVGRIGALVCVWSGTGLQRFSVGTGLTDAEREDPPRLGSTITVRYQELTPAGAPRFPRFVAVRDYE